MIRRPRSTTRADTLCPSTTRVRSGLVPARPEPSPRQVWLLQRSGGRPGARLGKTTGWVHRATLKAKGVKMLGGVEYLGVDDDGLRVRVDGSEDRKSTRLNSSH